MFRRRRPAHQPGTGHGYGFRAAHREAAAAGDAGRKAEGREFGNCGLRSFIFILGDTADLQEVSDGLCEYQTVYGNHDNHDNHDNRMQALVGILTRVDSHPGSLSLTHAFTGSQRHGL